MSEENAGQLASRIVTEARTWRGTKFERQGSHKGLGVGCAPFISEVIKACELVDSDANALEMLDALAFVSADANDARPGDVLALCDELLKEPEKPIHTGIITQFRDGRPYLIHAGNQGVVEHNLDPHWQRRAHSVWRLRRLCDREGSSALAEAKRAEFRAALERGEVGEPISILVSIGISTALSAATAYASSAIARLFAPKPEPIERGRIIGALVMEEPKR